MKYKLFRSLGSIDRDVKKHELVAVEYGRDIYEVTDALIKAAPECRDMKNMRLLHMPLNR